MAASSGSGGSGGSGGKYTDAQRRRSALTRRGNIGQGRMNLGNNQTSRAAIRAVFGSRAQNAPF